LFGSLIYIELQNYFEFIFKRLNIKISKTHQYFLVLFLKIVKKYGRSFLLSVGNVQEWFIKVSNHLGNNLRGNDTATPGNMLILC